MQQENNKGQSVDVTIGIDAMIVLNPCDIQLGLKEVQHDHVGNQRFEFITAIKVQSFIQSEGIDFQSLADEIVQEMKQTGGRFVQKNESNSWEVAEEGLVKKMVNRAISVAATQYDPEAKPPAPGTEVAVFSEKDVVFSQAATRHAGNGKLRQLVKLHADWYLKASNASSPAVQFLISKIHSNGGRFLVEASDNMGFLVATSSQAHDNVELLLRYYCENNLELKPYPATDERTTPMAVSTSEKHGKEQLEVIQPKTVDAKIGDLRHHSESEIVNLRRQLMQKKAPVGTVKNASSEIENYRQNASDHLPLRPAENKHKYHDVKGCTPVGENSAQRNAPVASIILAAEPSRLDGLPPEAPQRLVGSSIVAAIDKRRTAVGEDSAQDRDPVQKASDSEPFDSDPPELLERDVVVGCKVPAALRQSDVHKDYTRSFFQEIKLCEEQNIALTDERIDYVANCLVSKHAATGGRFIRFPKVGRMEVVETKDAYVHVKETMKTARRKAEAAGNGTKVTSVLLQCLGMEPWKRKSLQAADLPNKRQTTHDPPAPSPTIEHNSEVGVMQPPRQQNSTMFQQSLMALPPAMMRNHGPMLLEHFKSVTMNNMYRSTQGVTAGQCQGADDAKESTTQKTPLQMKSMRHPTINWQQGSSKKFKQQTRLVEFDAQPHRTHNEYHEQQQSHLLQQHEEQKWIRQEQQKKQLQLQIQQEQQEIRQLEHERLKQQLQEHQVKQNQVQLQLEMLLLQHREQQSQFQHQHSSNFEVVRNEMALMQEREIENLKSQLIQPNFPVRKYTVTIKENSFAPAVPPRLNETRDQAAISQNPNADAMLRESIGEPSIFGSTLQMTPEQKAMPCNDFKKRQLVHLQSWAGVQASKLPQHKEIQSVKSSRKTTTPDAAQETYVSPEVAVNLSHREMMSNLSTQGSTPGVVDEHPSYQHHGQSDPTDQSTPTVRINPPSLPIVTWKHLEKATPEPLEEQPLLPSDTSFTIPGEEESPDQEVSCDVMTDFSKWQFFPLANASSLIPIGMMGEWKLTLVPLENQADDPIHLDPGSLGFLFE